MDWNLIISVLSLLLGSGCVTWIFLAGQWKGEIDVRIETLRKTVEDIDGAIGVLSEDKASISNIHQATDTQSQKMADKLRIEMQQHVTRLHQRIDEIDATEKFRRSTLQQQEQQLSIVIAGIQSQRTEWEILRADVRKLLTSEATTAVEIKNVKDRLEVIETKKTELSEKIAGIRAEIDSILRERK